MDLNDFKAKPDSKDKFVYVTFRLTESQHATLLKRAKADGVQKKANWVTQLVVWALTNGGN